MRIFLDANILFSAARSPGAVRRFLVWLTGQNHRLVADAYVVSEARRNLEIKFPGALADLDSILKQIEIAETVPGEPEAGFAAELPEKDRPVLAAARDLGCAIVLTGDRRHFGSFFGGELEGIAIHSPASLLEFLLSRAGS